MGLLKIMLGLEPIGDPATGDKKDGHASIGGMSADTD